MCRVLIIEREESPKGTETYACHTFGSPGEVILAETEHGRAIVGVVDGGSPLGMETDEDVKVRRELLRKIGYKL